MSTAMNNTAINAPEIADQINVIAQKYSVWQLISSADPVGKSIILILILASIVSWAIIIDKYYRYSNIRAKMQVFENLFWSGQVLDILYEKIKPSIDNPMAAVFVAAMGECKRHDPRTKDTALKVGLKERIHQAMSLVRNREADKLEKNLAFLATVGSSATFIGILGTVLGIMHSFESIAASNNTSLAVVAPGIAESLLTTAIGLIAAIPAMIFYNFLSTQSNNILNRIEDFSYELHTILTRAIDEEKL